MGGGNPMMGLMQLLGNLGSGQVALAVTNEYVYVVKGDVLVQFSAKDLTEVKRVNLGIGPPPGMFGPMGGGGGMMGGQHQGQPGGGPAGGQPGVQPAPPAPPAGGQNPGHN